ncbi:tripartite motif-containing protein 43B-like [Peromyscus eremicus]|uniref:tripartite motif-containing protein 43B-like n=1 Tax=Peromyscus eremicus TaxID=42410 RepID=UPI0027DD0AD0|nr:tripartite motif-containing protein 43B-like [Peromyscus eremicus]
MESDISQAFQKELTCFICLSCLTDPVTITCGHSFCRACLHLFWEDIQPPVQCPKCRKPSQKDLRTNIVLKKLVSIVRQATLMKDLSSEEQKCVTHKDTKRIFCAENRIFLCQLCSNTYEHKGHRHCPIEAAAEDQMDRLLKQMTSLWEKVQENQENLEAENRMRTHWTGLDDMFRRSESVQLSMPQVIKVELSALPITGLTESYNQFQVHISLPNITIIHHKINLFNAMRRLNFRPHRKDTSADYAGCYYASWRSQSFILGKYYWEIDLKDSWDWAVGVCKDSLLWNRNQVIEPEGAFLLVCVKEGNHYSLLTTCPVFQHYIEKPLCRVGVFLDCEEGCLSFVNVAKCSLIYKYPPGTFKDPVWPYFSTGEICNPVPSDF